MIGAGGGMLRRGAGRAGLIALDIDNNPSNCLNLLPLEGSGASVIAGNRASAPPFKEHFSNVFR
jgi:hypothetical protein